MKIIDWWLTDGVLCGFLASYLVHRWLNNEYLKRRVKKLESEIDAIVVKYTEEKGIYRKRIASLREFIAYAHTVEGENGIKEFRDRADFLLKSLTGVDG